MKTFADIGVSDELIEILDSAGFKHPTPIQERSIPLILKGRDLIGQAETGSGKTAACGIPIVQMIEKSINAIQALIIAPTRELALQYLEEVSSFATPLGIKAFVIYGGFDIDIQMAKLKDGVQILVATPGRLCDIIYNQQFPLNNVRFFVIDEADEMLKMGFIEDVNFITRCIVQEHQTLLFSATMPPPIKNLANSYLKNPEHIRLNTEKVQPDNLTHKKINVRPADKERALLEIIRSDDIAQAIIFCNTRSRVEKLYKKIKKDIKGVDYIHGGLSQGRRTGTMNRFRKKNIKYMVTTDVMARGMDISGVSHIINFDVTNNPETYIHRSGRTARMGKKGVSISLVSSREEEMYNEIEKKSEFLPGKLKKSIFKGRNSRNRAGGKNIKRRRG